MRVKLSIVHEGQTFVGEIEVRPEGTQKVTVKPHGSATHELSDVATKPSSAIELLYRNKFFKDSRRLPDVVAKLRDDGYNFSRQSISMALKAASFLSVGGKRGTFEFVQKFPPHS